MLEKIDKLVSELTSIFKLNNLYYLILLFILSCSSGDIQIKQITTPSGTISTSILWDEPTTNNDGTPLTDVSGYKMYWGSTSGMYTNTLDLGRPLSCGPFPSTTCTYPIDFLVGNFYIVLTAYDTSGNESDYSNEVYK